jgi:hypothetical protein
VPNSTGIANCRLDAIADRAPAMRGVGPRARGATLHATKSVIRQEKNRHLRQILSTSTHAARIHL